MSQLPHRPYRLQPSKYFFDSLPFYLTYFISRMPGGSSVNRRASTIIILAHVRRYPRFSYTCYASTCVVGLICSQCHTSILIPYFIGELLSGLSLRSPSRLRYRRLHCDPVSILHQHVSRITQLVFLSFTLLAQHWLRICRRLMRLIRTLLPVEILCGISRIIRWLLLPTIFILETLQTRCCFQQRSIHREMFIAQQPMLPGLLEHLIQKRLRNLFID